MSEADMPTTEARSGADEQELVSYELAYHVLPTVVEGEVAEVRDRIAASITTQDGEVLTEEAPQRFDLAYEIDKYIEGKRRKFGSAYFGWIRFQADKAAIDRITEAVDDDRALLRYLLIRLTKTEEAAPFYFHEAMAAERKVTNMDEPTADIDPNAATTEVVDTEGIEEESATTAADTAETADTDATGAAPEVDSGKTT